MYTTYYKTKIVKYTYRVLIRVYKSKNDKEPFYEEIRKYKSTSWKCINNRIQSLMEKYNCRYGTADSIKEEI